MLVTVVFVPIVKMRRNDVIDVIAVRNGFIPQPVPC